MRSIKHDLKDLFLLSAMVLAFALAWGSPFVAAGTARAQDQAQPQQQQAQSKTFTGTVVKNGSQFALRDSSGKTYQLDDADRAKQFEGKTVKVTGQLDEQAMVIHVESIASSEG
jgi:hypothetical protein